MLAARTTAVMVAPHQVPLGPARVWLRPFYGAYERWLEYAVGPTVDRDASPTAAITAPVSLWHLAEIAHWLRKHTNRTPPADVVEVARATAKMNLDVDARRVQRTLETV